MYKQANFPDVSPVFGAVNAQDKYFYLVDSQESSVECGLKRPPMKKRYHVKLTNRERQELDHLIHKGKANARKINRARVLLLADQGKTDATIREQVGVRGGFVE
jgi:hypothetical protein